jgi:hypothetical protein
MALKQRSKFVLKRYPLMMLFLVFNVP